MTRFHPLTYACLAALHAAHVTLLLQNLPQLPISFQEGSEVFLAYKDLNGLGSKQMQCGEVREPTVPWFKREGVFCEGTSTWTPGNQIYYP